MNKVDLGQILTILANIGVIAGIVFLGFELNQNQIIGRAQVRNEIARAEHELTMWDWEHDMREFMIRSSAGEMSEDVQDAVEHRAALWFRHYQNVNYQYRLGLFDESEYAPVMNGLIDGLDRVALWKFNFCRRRNVLSPDFVQEVESRLATPCE